MVYFEPISSGFNSRKITKNFFGNFSKKICQKMSFTPGKLSRTGRAETRSRAKDDVRRVMQAVDKVWKNLVKLQRNAKLTIFLDFRFVDGKNDGWRFLIQPWRFWNGFHWHSRKESDLKLRQPWFQVPIVRQVQNHKAEGKKLRHSNLQSGFDYHEWEMVH